mgnify:CR=1 FL=1
MKSQIENLPFKSKLSVPDALAALSQATGFNDQGLQDKMPLLKNHQGTVTLSDISGANITRVMVALEGSNMTYLIDFNRDSEPTIQPLEHDDFSAFQNLK